MSSAASASIASRPIHVVDVSGISVPAARTARRPGGSRTRAVAATVFAVAVVLGTAVGASLTGAGTDVDGSRFGPWVGEYRLSPGNLAPIGIVADRADVPSIGFGPTEGEYRLAPGNLPPVGITGS